MGMSYEPLRKAYARGLLKQIVQNGFRFELECENEELLPPTSSIEDGVETYKELEKFIEKHDIPFKRLQKEPFLTTAQCAKFCYVTTNTITKWIDSGLIPSFNLGTERRLTFYRDMLRFMKGNKMPLTRIKEFTPSEPGERPKSKKQKNGRKKPKAKAKVKSKAKAKPKVKAKPKAKRRRGKAR